MLFCVCQLVIMENGRRTMLLRQSDAPKVSLQLLKIILRSFTWIDRQLRQQGRAGVRHGVCVAGNDFVGWVPFDEAISR